MAIYLHAHAQNTSSRNLGKWVADGVLQWNNPDVDTTQNNTSAGYAYEQSLKRNGIFELNMMKEVAKETISFVDCGQFRLEHFFVPDCPMFEKLVFNITYGMIVLVSLIVADVVRIFHYNKYHFMSNKAYKCESRVQFICAALIWIGKILTNVMTAIACTRKIIATSVDISMTLTAGVEAYFLLGIDDCFLLALVWLFDPEGVLYWDPYAYTVLL